ncbi:hypothetical protein D3C83_192060 [compost metagenome]
MPGEVDQHQVVVLGLLQEDEQRFAHGLAGGLPILEQQDVVVIVRAGLGRAQEIVHRLGVA